MANDDLNIAADGGVSVGAPTES